MRSSAQATAPKQPSFKRVKPFLMFLVRRWSSHSYYLFRHFFPESCTSSIFKVFRSFHSTAVFPGAQVKKKKNLTKYTFNASPAFAPHVSSRSSGTLLLSSDHLPTSPFIHLISEILCRCASQNEPFSKYYLHHIEAETPHHQLLLGSHVLCRTLSTRCAGSHRCISGKKVVCWGLYS